MFLQDQQHQLFDVIIPPQGGHGADVYSELGSTNVLIYSRIENDEQNPDFVTGASVARIGIVENPKGFESNTILTDDRASSLYGLYLRVKHQTKMILKQLHLNQIHVITQTVGTGVTAVLVELYLI